MNYDPNNRNLPDSIHLITYDVRGTVVNTGQVKKCRQTGIVTHTHHLINGLKQLNPDINISVTQTGAKESFAFRLITPEGHNVFAQGLKTSFPEYIGDKATGGKDKLLTKYYYEETINDSTNPIYKSLAHQYATAIRKANTSSILLENPNTLIGVMMAERYKFLDKITLSQLNVSAIIHDVEGYTSRLKFVRDSLEKTNINLKIIAVSQFVHRRLIEMGFPKDKTFLVPNGIDVGAFLSTLNKARKNKVFESVRKNNGLPKKGKMILIPARRVEHKGHNDVIRAFKEIKASGNFDDFYLAITGCHMLCSQSLKFESDIRKEIKNNDLSSSVYLLGHLSSEELAACYDDAFVSVLASTEPEGFAYANIEAMLASTPVITTRLGGPLDYIHHNQTGIFVQPNRPREIAEAIKQLKSDRQLYKKLAINGKKEAEKYTLKKMLQGYAGIINMYSTRLPIRFSISKEFEKIGEGMHSEVYAPVNNESFVVQIFKKDRSDLDINRLIDDYKYLVESYDCLPKLIPAQELKVHPNNPTLHSSVIVKEKVDSAPSNNLKNLNIDQIDKYTLDQIRSFIRVTKDLISKKCMPIPDIIDPYFNNLVVDINGDLKLLDTNRLISTKHFNEILFNHKKLDINEKIIHTLVLRRLMFLDSKFNYATTYMLKLDPFYLQYLNLYDFQKLFDASKSVRERIPTKKHNLSLSLQ